MKTTIFSTNALLASFLLCSTVSAESIDADILWCTTPTGPQAHAKCKASVDATDPYNFVSGLCELFKEGSPTTVAAYDDGDRSDIPIGEMFTTKPQTLNLSTTTPREPQKEFCAIASSTVFYGFVVDPDDGYVIKNTPPPFPIQEMQDVSECDTFFPGDGGPGNQN